MNTKVRKMESRNFLRSAALFLGVIITCAVSLLIQGCQVCGPRNGHGTLTLPDGAKYVGEFKDGKQNGQGTVTSPDGTKYVGGFKDGKPTGKGTTTLPNGMKFGE